MRVRVLHGSIKVGHEWCPPGSEVTLTPEQYASVQHVVELVVSGPAEEVEPAPQLLPPSPPPERKRKRGNS